MLLKALGNDGAVTGTGTFPVALGMLGGVLITADGTNNATVILRREDSTGKQVFDLVTKSPTFIAAPIGLEGSKVLYYNVSGTGAAAQFFEWVE